MTVFRDALLATAAGTIRDVARRYGACRVRVFGSRARGTAAAGSDLDLLVRMEPGRDLLDLIAIKQDLEQQLGVHVDVVEEEGVSPLLRDRVLHDAVPV